MFKDTDRNIIDIEPLNPVIKGHRLIIPRQHVSDFKDNPAITAEVMEYVSRLASDLETFGNPDWNIITSAGSFASQTVWHFHVHLIPRRLNDGLKLPWTKY